MYDVDPTGWLTSCVAREDEEGVMQHLIHQSPAALDRLGMSALHYAALGKNINIMIMLLAKTSKTGVNVLDCHDRTPLHVAAGKGNEVMMRSLIVHGADQTIKDWNGFTAAELFQKTIERERKNANYRD